MTATHASLLDRMSDHVLAHGLTQATLRPLARAAGTSDRMLIYHFGSKNGVIAAVLDHLAARLTALLDAAPLATQDNLAGMIEALLGLMRDAAARPYVRVWLEVIAGAGRDSPAHRAAAARILAHFHGWIAARLPVSATGQDAAGDKAAFVLAVIEGCLLLGAAGETGATLAKQAVNGLAHRSATPEGSSA